MSSIRLSSEAGATNNKTADSQNQTDMNKQNYDSCKGVNNHDHNRHPATDRVNYRSSDGLVEVRTKVSKAKRFPQRGYPVVCLHLRPKPGSRVQLLTDGSAGIDVLFNHRELTEMLAALNQADPKSQYTWREIPGKPVERKAYWDSLNRRRRKQD